MYYPKQTDNYDVDIFNQNFRELANGNSTNDANLQSEIERAKAAERVNANAISAETSRAMVAEQSNYDAIVAETNRALAQEALKAPVESPAFTGAPQAPTPEISANDLRIATTAFVKAVVNALIDGAPETLDTLREVADAIVEHREITDALNAAIGNKVDKISGKGLSSNDYTTEEKQKLSSIESGAEVNVQPDFDVTDSNSNAYIKNKPTIPTKTSQLINDSGFLTSESAISGVSGVKGNAESNYRTGNVNLTPDDIGAVATANVLATADQINANTDPANVAGATAVKEMVSQMNSNIQKMLVINDVFLNDSTGPYQITYQDGDLYELHFTLNNAILDGYKLLCGYVYTAWTSSHLWVNYYISNPLVLSEQGVLQFYIKDAPKNDITLAAALRIACILVKS